MSLRRAIERLPDDRETASAMRKVVSFLQSHPDEPFSAERLGRAISVPEERLGGILKALSDSFVIDCGGDSDYSACTFTPTTVLSLEIRRFLRAGSGSHSTLQRGVDRFRNRYGNDR